MIAPEAAYSADRAVDNAYAHFLVGELLKGLLDSLDGALYVRLDDDRKLLDGAFLDGGEQVVKSYLVVSLELLFLSFLAALLNEFPCELLVLYSARPMISTGTDGPASLTVLPLSSRITRTLPTDIPAMSTSPAWRVPF